MHGLWSQRRVWCHLHHCSSMSSRKSHSVLAAKIPVHEMGLHAPPPRVVRKMKWQWRAFSTQMYLIHQVQASFFDWGQQETHLSCQNRTEHIAPAPIPPGLPRGPLSTEALNLPIMLIWTKKGQPQPQPQGASLGIYFQEGCTKQDTSGWWEVALLPTPIGSNAL